MSFRLRGWLPVLAVVSALLLAGRPAAAQEYTDDFNDNTTDTFHWAAFDAGGSEIAETNERLEVVVPADAQGGFIGSGYLSNCVLRGNFDMQVDFHLLQFPFQNGVRVGLAARGARVGERTSFGSSLDFAAFPREVYLTDAADGVRGIRGTTHASGTLRLVRSGSVITGYFWDPIGAQWVAVHSSPSTTADVAPLLQVWSHDYAFMDMHAHVAFDNFRISSGTLICPNRHPTVHCPPSATVECDSPAGTSVPLSAHVSDPDGDALTVQWHVDGHLAQTDVVPAHGGGTSADVPFTHTYPLGPHSVLVVVNDGSEGVSCPTTVTVVDTTPPSITCPVDITVGNGPGQCSALVNPGNATASDNHVIAVIAIIRPDGRSVTDPFPVGVTTVTWIATDVTGNSASCEQRITVNDTEAPVIGAVTHVTVDEADPLGTPVPLAPPGVSDNCDPSPALSNNSPPLYLLGTTTVVWTAVDDYGNMRTAHQQVTVAPGSPQNQLANLSTLIGYLAASGGVSAQIQGSLQAKVNAALDALARGNSNDAKVAMNALKALVNQVEAQTDHQITPAAAAAIVARANSIIAALGG